MTATMSMFPMHAMRSGRPGHAVGVVVGEPHREVPASVGRAAPRPLHEVASGQVVDDVGARVTGGDQDRLDEVLRRVVDDQVGAEGGAQGSLLRTPRHRNDPCPGRLPELDPGRAQSAGGGMHDQGLARLEAPSLEEGEVRRLEGQQEGGGLDVVELGGASNTEMASAMAYSAMPPSAFLVMATTRWPNHDSAPSPAASTTPQTSMPSVNGGGVGTETSLPRQRSMSLKLSDAAPTLTRTSPGPGSGRSMVCTARTSPGCP